MLRRRKCKLRLKQSITLEDPEFQFTEKFENRNSELYASEIILLLLSISPIKGNTKLQKEVFLAWREFLKNKTSELGYFPYRYGAYSRLVEDTVKLLQLQNKIKIEKRRGEGTVFSITKKGKQLLTNITKRKKTSDTKLRKTKNRFGDKLEDQKIDWDDWSPKAILKYTYRNFPEYTTKSRVPSLKW